MMIGPSSAHGKVVPCHSSGHGLGPSIYGCTLENARISARLKAVAFLSGLCLILVGIDEKPGITLTLEPRSLSL